jgi:TRAP-type mannitol/chloroaromatic compound transport system permease large subunit
MGLILERSGMAEDLLDTIGQLFGPIRGGLAYAVILVGAMLAATTGVVAASVISMGLISLPIMLRYGYDRRVASGVIAASGTLAQIIPPSLVLIIMADQLGKSVGDLYKGAFIPGFVLTGLYVGYILLVSLIKPTFVPGPAGRGPHHPRGRRHLRPAFAGHLDGAVGHRRGRLCQDAPRGDPAGREDRGVHVRRHRCGLLCCRTQQGHQARPALAHGRTGDLCADPAAGADLPGAGHDLPGHCHADRRRRHGRHGRPGDGDCPSAHRLQVLRQAMDSTMKLSCFVLFILVGARCSAWRSRASDGPVWGGASADRPARRTDGLPDRREHLVFLLAFFLDFFELAFIIVPLLGPVAEKLGIDLVWFGVLLAVNMQTSFMHPPFGFALFYLRSVAPVDDYTDKVTKKPIKKVTIEQIYWGSVPFVLIQIIMVGLIIAFPQKKPRLGGVFSCPIAGSAPHHSFWACMKSSNDASGKRNQRFASRR